MQQYLISRTLSQDNSNFQNIVIFQDIFRMRGYPVHDGAKLKNKFVCLLCRGGGGRGDRVVVVMSTLGRCVTSLQFCFSK
jgi:hypothetical protein